MGGWSGRVWMLVLILRGVMMMGRWPDWDCVLMFLFSKSFLGEAGRCLEFVCYTNQGLTPPIELLSEMEDEDFDVCRADEELRFYLYCSLQDHLFNH